MRLARSRRGDRHHEVLISLGRLGMVLKDQGNLEAAGEVLEETLDLSLELNGGRHHATGIVLCHLGDLRRQQGKWELAENLLRRCREILRDTSENHFRFSLPFTGLGRLAMDTGRPEDAERLLRRSFEIRRRWLGEDDWWTAESAGELGVCLAALGRDSEAEELLRRRVEHHAARLEPSDYRRVRAEAELDAFYAERPWLARARRSAPRAMEPVVEPALGEIPEIGGR